MSRSANRPKRDVPAPIRANVLLADSCFYCGDVLLVREVEHRVPLSRGGTNDRANLVAGCVSCNSQKRAMLVSEWRVYRTTHGMPWPPMASHPTEPAHYGDACAACRDAHLAATGFATRPVHAFIVTPHELEVCGDRRYRCYYRCPAGHQWNCYRRIDRGYFSDCPCAYCWHARVDEGDEHFVPRPRYEDPEWLRPAAKPTCADCGYPLDLMLAAAGETLHPSCGVAA